jgi:hypothetical protein
MARNKFVGLDLKSIRRNSSFDYSVHGVAVLEAWGSSGVRCGEAFDDPRRSSLRCLSRFEILLVFSFETRNFFEHGRRILEKQRR